MSRPSAVPVVGLLAAAATVITLASPAQAIPAEDVVGGTTSAPSGRLLNGCHAYSYAYAIQVPTNDWLLEISIVDRRGQAVAAGAFLGPSDEKTHTSSFGLCRGSTVPGKFRIRAKLLWFDDPTTPNRVPVPVTRFRLARP